MADSRGIPETGDSLPAVERRVTLQDVVRYCGLTWDAPPFFYDADAAAKAGLPGTIIPGPFKLTLVYRAVEDWLGSRGRIVEVRLAHRRPDITGSSLSVTGEVVAVSNNDTTTALEVEVRILGAGGGLSSSGTVAVEWFGD